MNTKTGPNGPKTPIERHNRESSRANRSLLRLAGFAHLSLSKVTHQSRKFIPALLIALIIGVFTSTPPTAIYETMEISSTPHLSAIYKAGPTLNTVAGDLIGALHDTLQNRTGNLHQQTQTRSERGTARRQRNRRRNRARPAKQSRQRTASAAGGQHCAKTTYRFGRKAIFAAPVTVTECFLALERMPSTITWASINS